MKYIINEGKIGYLVRNGKFIKLLQPGGYTYSGKLGYAVHIVDASGEVDTCSIPVARLMEDECFARYVVHTNVPVGTYAFIIANGRPIKCVTGCEVLYWELHEKIEIRLFTPESPELPADFPRELLNVIAPLQHLRVSVPADSVAVLYYDNCFEGMLEPGVYRFWRGGVEVSARIISLARQLLDLPHQELLTADKVTVRVTMSLEYAITKPRLFAEGIKDGSEMLRLAAQLALRDYVGGLKFEELLEKRSDFSSFLLERLRESDCAGWCEFFGAGLKDVIIPGDVREIMNTVLIAEKQAQASVITRREEVASTRSLLNTARMMEENPTLMHLKELEYLERICQKVDSISVSGGADLLGKLSELCSGGKK